MKPTALLIMGYTGLDPKYLGVIAAAARTMLTLTWNVRLSTNGLGGSVAARALPCGMQFADARPDVTLVRGASSAFLGGLSGALVETLVPTYGAFTNHGLSRGLASEAAYALFSDAFLPDATASMTAAALVSGAVRGQLPH